MALRLDHLSRNVLLSIGLLDGLVQVHLGVDVVMSW